MYYIIYKTTNKTNDKFYIGYHSTNNLNDNYLGSGKILKKALEKYSKENFIKEILYIYPTKEEALLKEKEIVDSVFIKRDDTYNFKLGGEGGWDHIPKMIKDDKEFKKKMYSKISKTMKKLHKEGKLKGWNKNYKGPNGMRGKKHTEESKKKISLNNGSRLPEETTNNRIKDILEIKKEWGWVTKLSKKWGISHTQVKRFIKKNNIEIL